MNGTQDNVIYEAGEIANISALLNVTELVIIETNFTGSTTQLVNGTTSAENLTNTSNLVETALYNVTAFFTANENYTGSSVTYNLAVCPVCPEPGNWTDCVGGEQNRTNYYCNSTSSYDCQNYTQVNSCGGSGGTGGGTPSIKEYNITDNLTKGAAALALGQGSKARFRYQNQSHIVTVKTVGNTYVVIEVASDTQEAVLYIGQTEKFDLDGDGTDDLSVSLNGISSSKATLIIDLIEEVKTLAQPPMLPTVQSEPPTESESEEPEDEPEEEPEGYPLNQTVVFLVIGAVIVAFLFKLYGGTKIGSSKSGTKFYEPGYGVEYDRQRDN